MTFLIATAAYDIVLEGIGAIAITTGVFGAGGHSLAVLMRYPRDQVEWMTAVGFAFGAGVAVVLFLLRAFG